MFKLAPLVCALALFQSTTALCIGAYNGFDFAAGYGCGGGCGPAFAGPFGGGLGPANLAASNGAGLVVTSASPIAPTGVTMTSENYYEGPLAVSGVIPFLGAVTLEGALPTEGGGAVTYGCGNGNVAIVSEDVDGPYDFGLNAFDGFAGPFGYSGYSGLGYGFGGACGFEGLGYGFGGLNSFEGLGCGFSGAYGFDGLGYGFGGAYGFDGLGYGFGGPYGFGGLGCGFAGRGPYGYNGFGFGGPFN